MFITKCAGGFPAVLCLDKVFETKQITLGTTLPSTLASVAHVNAHAYTGVIGSVSMTPIEVYFVVLRKT